MTQLEIDLEVHGTVLVSDAGPKPVSVRRAHRTDAAPKHDQGILPGTDPEGRFRASEQLGPKLRLQTEHYVRQLEERGTDWLLDDEARQWLNDLEVVRAHYRNIEREWFDEGNGGSEDGLYAVVIERIVGRQAKAAYQGEPVAKLDDLFDPHCLVIDELDSESAEPEDAAIAGDQPAARRVARPTRKRAKAAVARARVFDRHPEWRHKLETRSPKKPLG